jgi:ribosome-binding protein aMBF1 (putative translation factor)
MDNMDNHFNTLDHQDWKTIVIRKNPKKNVANSKKKIDNTVLKKISIEKKAEADDLHHKQLTVELRQSIQKARCAKSLTQKQLANNVNLSQQIISDIESGKAIYNAQHINKIKRHLKLK